MDVSQLAFANPGIWDEIINKGCWSEQEIWKQIIQQGLSFGDTFIEIILTQWIYSETIRRFCRFGTSQCNWGRCTWNPSVHHQTILMWEMLFFVLAQYCPKLIHSSSYVYKHPWRQIFTIWVPLKAEAKFIKHFWKAAIFFWGGAKRSVWTRGCTCIR